MSPTDQRTESISGFLAVLRTLRGELLSDHVQMVAAAMTFYAVFGLLPGLAAAAALWSQFGNIEVLRQSVQTGSDLVPKGTMGVLSQFISSVPEGFGGGTRLAAELRPGRVHLLSRRQRTVDRAQHRL